MRLFLSKKRRMRFAALISCLLLCICTACSGGNSQPDAGALFREAVLQAEKAPGSTSWFQNELLFTLDGQETELNYSLHNDTVYRKDPFGLYVVSVSNTAGEPAALETYIINSEGNYLIYNSYNDIWQKSSLNEMDTTASRQIDLLQFLSADVSQNYIREEDYSNTLCHKIEVTFNGEALRSFIEAIVASSNMDNAGDGLANLLVESLSNREDGDALHAYVWIEKDTGLLLGMEADASSILQKTFDSIDGAETGVKILSCKISGGFTEIEGGSFPELPEAAKNASSADAVG